MVVMVCLLMEEESTFYPHYEIHLLIDEPQKPIPGGSSMRYHGTIYPMKKGMKRGPLQQGFRYTSATRTLIPKRKSAIPKAEIIKWCDENLGKDYYHLGVDKVVVYSEINVMAVKLSRYAKRSKSPRSCRGSAPPRRQAEVGRGDLQERAPPARLSHRRGNARTRCCAVRRQRNAGR